MNEIISLGPGCQVEHCEPATTEQLIKEKLKILKAYKETREAACGSIELQIEDLRAELEEKSKPYDAQMQAIESELKNLILNIAHTIKTEHGAVNFKKGHIRASYDTKALDMLCASRKDINEAISPFRKVTPVSPSVSVEVY